MSLDEELDLMLQKVIISNAVDSVEHYTKLGVKITERHIQLAVVRSSVQMLERLTGYAEDPSVIKDMIKNDAKYLHLATMNGNYDIASYLINDLGVKLSDNALSIAVDSEKVTVDVIKLLLDNGLKIRWMDLEFALSNDNIEVFKYLYENSDKDINKKFPIYNYRSSDAGCHDISKCVQFLIQKGSDINMGLIHALNNLDEDLIIYLLDIGATIEASELEYYIGFMPDILIEKLLANTVPSERKDYLINRYNNMNSDSYVTLKDEIDTISMLNHSLRVR